ncbi:MAG: Na+/H+ antiporter NhaC family protein [Alphaproteobacteria bacterium]|nr:Na+/H+ antiporter NhaC family protein [Alphaproteobacteria bacterium]
MIAGDLIRRVAVSLAFCVCVAVAASAALAQETSIELEVPDVILQGVPFEVKVKDPEGRIVPGMGHVISVEGRDYPIDVVEGEAVVSGVVTEGGSPVIMISHPSGTNLVESTVSTIPGWMSILPALIAIVIALALRQVIPALFLGIWLGGALVYGLSLSSIWYGLVDTVPEHVLNALNDWGHLAVILFSLMIGGMVGIISRNGGTAGIVNGMVNWARSPKRGQLTTSVLGVAIFFDDYANTLIVGNTMRPIADRLRISREKLAYIVDSTAAPVATIALVTTWIGFEVGLIGESVSKIEGFEESAYSIFLNSIAYSFYPILAILFVFLIAASGRDFGPMLKAERRARSEGLVSRIGAHVGESPQEAAEREPKPDKPQRALNAVVPVLVLVVGTMIGIYVTGTSAEGEDASLRDIIGSGDSYLAMMWASLIAVVVAIALSLGQGILSLSETIDAWYAGVRSMLLAIIILVLAWSLANVNDALHTGDFLVTALGDTVPAQMVPTLVFALAAATAFATGSSWGVMGIMMPLAIPLTWAIMAANGLTDDGAHVYLIYSTVAAVMGGAVWGDHCSPISDTTILSSLASGCDHIDHVRTQIPYALGVGVVAVGLGTIPTGYGYSWWLALLAGAAVLVVGLWAIGRRSDDGSRA